MHNDMGNTLPMCIYPIKYLNESLSSYECLPDNTFLLIFTSSILIGLLFFRNVFLLIQFSPKIKSFLFYFYTM